MVPRTELAARLAISCVVGFAIIAGPAVLFAQDGPLKAALDNLVAAYPNALAGHDDKALRWRDGDTVPVPLAAIRVVRYWQGTDPGPHYASTSRESPVRNERRTPGSARGIRKPSGSNP